MNYLGGDGANVGLFSEQVHDVGGEFVTGGLVLLQLGVVRAADLGQFGSEEEKNQDDTTLAKSIRPPSNKVDLLAKY